MHTVKQELAACGINDIKSGSSPRLISMHKLRRLIDRFATLLNDKKFYIRHLDRVLIGYHGPVDTAILTAPSLGASFSMYHRYYSPMISNGVRFQYSEDDDGGWLRWVYTPDFDTSHMVACRACLIVLMRMRDLYGADLNPMKVLLKLPRVEEAELLFDVFDVPPDFSASTHGIAFSHEDMARENMVADEWAHAEALRQADRMLAEQAEMETQNTTR